MKKLLVLVLLAGASSFYACQPKETGTVGVETDSEQNTGNDGIVYPNENDTSNADVIEKTQTRVGNSKTRGEENHSNSQTTENVVVTPDSAQ